MTTQLSLLHELRSWHASDARWVRLGFLLPCLAFRLYQPRYHPYPQLRVDGRGACWARRVRDTLLREHGSWEAVAVAHTDAVRTVCEEHHHASHIFQEVARTEDRRIRREVNVRLDAARHLPELMHIPVPFDVVMDRAGNRGAIVLHLPAENNPLPFPGGQSCRLVWKESRNYFVWRDPESGQNMVITHSDFSHVITTWNFLTFLLCARRRQWPVCEDILRHIRSWL